MSSIAEAAPGWYLALDDDTTELVALHEPVIRLGRGPHCDVRLDHPSVAFDHAALAVRSGSLTLFAINAERPTMVNGRVVREQAHLDDYDVVRLGDVMIVVRRIRR